MAKDEDLKRVDLKVSVNCCEGCRRKVLKALSMEGILKTEIHPTLPKVTVTGNIAVQTLIRKLAKVGKTAELWPSTAAPKPEREVLKSKSSDKADIDRDIHEQPRIDEGNSTGKSSSKPAKASGDKADSTTGNRGDNYNTAASDHKGAKETASDKNCAHEISPPQVSNNNLYPPMVAEVIPPVTNCVVNPSTMQNQANVMVPQPRFYHPMETYLVPMPVMNGYSATPPPPPPPCCIRQGHCYCQLPGYHRPPPSQLGIADYFNDDNTAGCVVM